MMFLSKYTKILAWTFVGAFVGGMLGVFVPTGFCECFPSLQPVSGLIELVAFLTGPAGFVIGCVSGAAYGARLTVKASALPKQLIEPQSSEN